MCKRFTGNSQSNQIKSIYRYKSFTTLFIAYKQSKHENITFRHTYTQHKYRYIMHHPRSLFSFYISQDKVCSQKSSTAFLFTKTIKSSRNEFYADCSLSSEVLCCKHYISMYLDEYLTKLWLSAGEKIVTINTSTPKP